MGGRVIQGFFIGGAMRPQPAPRAPAAEALLSHPTGAPPPAFAGRAPPLQPRMAPGPPSLVHRDEGHVAQPRGSDGTFEIDPVQLGLARGGGQPLPEAVLAKMEAAFGVDFSAVRVHVGPQASRIGAIAFTTGNDLYFAPGRYQPESVQGQQLIGHELAHVVQQRQGRVAARASGVAVVQDRALEAEADRLGMRAAAIVVPSGPGARRDLQCKPANPPVHEGATRTAMGRAAVQAAGAFNQPYKKWANSTSSLRRGGVRRAKWLRELEAEPERRRAAAAEELLEREAETLRRRQGQRHGFDLLELGDKRFERAFRDMAAYGKIRGHTITDYDAYKLLERALGSSWLKGDADLIRRFRDAVGLEPKPKEIARNDAHFRDGIGFKRNRGEQLRSVLLGTYLRPDQLGVYHPRTLGDFVQTDPSKRDRRQQKWLRVADADWTGEVNGRWVKAGIQNGYPFKIVAPLNPGQRDFLLEQIRRRVKGYQFLASIRRKYYNPLAPTFGSNNPLWNDTPEDDEAHAPSFLAYEIADLIEAGYKVDPNYLRPELIKLMPPGRAD
jgi:hypothetical protein